jgi:hypothetical protein
MTEPKSNGLANFFNKAVELASRPGVGQAVADVVRQTVKPKPEDAPSLLDLLKSGVLPVSESALDFALRLQRWEGVEYRSCRCSPSGVQLTFARSVMGVEVAIGVTLRVAAVDLNAARQAVRVEVSGGDVTGTTLLERIVAFFVGLVFSVPGVLPLDGADFGEDSDRIASTGDSAYEVDISRLKLIRPLLERKLPLVETPIIALCPPMEVRHRAGGLDLALSAAPSTTPPSGTRTPSGTR